MHLVSFLASNFKLILKWKNLSIETAFYTHGQKTLLLRPYNLVICARKNLNLGFVTSLKFNYCTHFIGHCYFILPPSQNKSLIHFVSECLGPPATEWVCQRHFLIALGVLYNVLGIRFACTKRLRHAVKICEGSSF